VLEVELIMYKVYFVFTFSFSFDRVVNPIPFLTNIYALQTGKMLKKQTFSHCSFTCNFSCPFTQIYLTAYKYAVSVLTTPIFTLKNVYETLASF